MDIYPRVVDNESGKKELRKKGFIVQQFNKFRFGKITGDFISDIRLRKNEESFHLECYLNPNSTDRGKEEETVRSLLLKAFKI